MFTINGIPWKVHMVSSNHHKLLRGDGTVTIGSCDNITKTIYICDTISLDMIKKVLCHEITHAAMFSYNVSLNIEQEELLADLIATYGSEIIDITNKVFKKLKGG